MKEGGMTVAALNALAPIVLLIGLGYFLKRARVLDEAFWPQAERICYFVLLPALFFHGTATAEIGNYPPGASLSRSSPRRWFFPL
jgi:malonate transporter and related proteins